MDTNVRVLVANRPRLMRELVLSTLSEQAGIRVVGEAANEQDVPVLVGAYGQQPSPRQMEKSDKTAQAEPLKKQEPRHLPDIFSDNLDRVSATPEQILQIVDRDPGMMVELKRLFAEDAGTSGQILEETVVTPSFSAPHYSFLNFPRPYLLCFQPATLGVRKHRGASHV